MVRQQRMVFMLLIIIGIWSLSAISAYGQTNTPVSIEQAYGIGIQVAWAMDDTFFVYTIFGSGLIEEKSSADWRKYELQTGTLSEHNLWPLLPVLSAQDTQLFAPNNDMGQSAMFESPDKRFIVFAGQGDYYSEAAIWHFMIAARLTNTVVDTPLKLLYPFTLDGRFNIIWASDSNSFIVAQSIGFGAGGGLPAAFAFVTNVQAGLPHLLIKKDINEFYIGSDKYYMTNIEDLSPDGSKALLVATKNGDRDYLYINFIRYSRSEPK